MLATKIIGIEDILEAATVLKDIIQPTPLQRDPILSEKYQCNVFLKREDMQLVRSFKIRGAYNAISSISDEEKSHGVVCASAGNHAQGVAYTCQQLHVHGKIFMPRTTPSQKVSRVKFFGGDMVEIILTGETFDDSYDAAVQYCENNHMKFIHPFDDQKVIAGQGTVGLEILQQAECPIDYIFASIGGGGLIAGTGLYTKEVSPQTAIIGVEPAGAASMKAAFDYGASVRLENIDKFVDGAAVQKVGKTTFELAKDIIDDFISVPEGNVCTAILDLYNTQAIVAEPAGALTVAALDMYKEKIKGKNIVCIISGGNNDVNRMQEIKDRSLMYKGLKRYFIIRFPKDTDAVQTFMSDVLTRNILIKRFEYMNNHGPALISLQLSELEDYQSLITRMNQSTLRYVEIHQDNPLYYLIVD